MGVREIDRSLEQLQTSEKDLEGRPGRPDPEYSVNENWEASMRTGLVTLLLVLSVTILGCEGSASFEVGGRDCKYANALIEEVTDNSGTVYKIIDVKIESAGYDEIRLCGVSKEATPAEVDGKYYFTAENGVEIEGVPLGQLGWYYLVGPILE